MWVPLEEVLRFLGSQVFRAAWRGEFTTTRLSRPQYLNASEPKCLAP
jgi:hypothetical protein